MKNLKITAKQDKTNVIEPFDYGIFQTNMWNAKYIDGMVSISREKEGIKTKIKTKDVILKQKTIYGYPEIAIGNNLLGEPFNSSGVKILNFPMKIQEFMDMNVRSETEFSINGFKPGTLPFNVAYDFWIKEVPFSKDHPTDNDSEIMIWLYRKDQYPIGVQMGQEKFNCIKDGIEKSIDFSVFVGRGARWLTVSFIIDNGEQDKEENLNIPVGDFLRVAMKYIPDNSLDRYIMGIELGSEFGNESSRKMLFEWTLKRYKLTVNGNEFNMIL